LSFSKCGGKAGKGFELLLSSELSEKRIESTPDELEEAFVAAPAAIALGVGRVGKSFVLGNRRSSYPMREMIVPSKGMILKDWGTKGEQWRRITCDLFVGQSKIPRENVGHGALLPWEPLGVVINSPAQTEIRERTRNSEVRGAIVVET
jgi:hypothetical protein